MAGMWELPQLSETPDEKIISAKWRTFRHSITITDYTVHVVRAWEPGPSPKGNVAVPAGGKPGKRDKWVAIETIPQLPITGLTRKILKAGGII